MIIRIFEVTIHPEFREEFERDFNTISVDTVNNHQGLISYSIGGPTKWNPDSYAMVTCWKDEDSLIAFAGKEWNQAIIPEQMQRYPKAFRVAHFDSSKLADSNNLPAEVP
jgi:heme oxygenase (mycobilin-producing)